MMDERFKHRSWITVSLMAVLTFGFIAACGDDDEEPTPSPQPAATATTPAGDRPVITLTGHDFSFEGPDVVEAGWIDVTFANKGAEPHHAQFAKLNEGVTMDQLMEALQNGPEATFPLVTFAGGPSVVGSGQEIDVSMNLEAGSYAILCFVESADGVMHLAKGMAMPLMVTAGTVDAPAPEADVVVSMEDFAFDLPETLDAGEVTIRAENHGGQPHEMVVVKLNEGATADDAVAFFSGELVNEPPPFVEVGGVQAMAAHGVGVVTLNLEAGEYVAICVVPDPETGQPHYVLGMIDEFAVE